ncbi:MerR family transcriptional regulator [Evansella sp. AB-P1]|uniref:MerR family transcriptional regulator n=1 Tax=Evansella sp. AB-P1 TaxID=3037653 RepID=UPI00241CE325|nr:MerR family transcriptional regulator [Evansella sp. AB-P1]MDG5790016.1 MerR family transcriptional regulator [Evansella sp. AB-P1]
MQIKDVEKRTGLTKKAIRYYEEAGLIQTSRKENRYKEYSNETIDILLKVKQLRLLGFSVDEIKRVFSEENHEEIIMEKLKENEVKLKQTYAVKQVLEIMLEGNTVESFDVEKLLLKEKTKEYMYIRHNNLLFGLINLVAFIGIYIYFFSNINSISYSSGSFLTLLSVQGIACVWLMSYQQKRKKKARNEGILLMEIKPLERLVQFIVFILTYVLTARMCVEGFYFAQRYLEWGEDYFLVIGNITLGLFMSFLGILILIASFIDTNKSIGEFVLFSK